MERHWQTGRLIHEHLLHHDSRSEYYGRQVIERLAKDLEISDSVLWRCLQFAQRFKILARGRESFPSQLSWTHYRKLITVADDETRLTFLRRAQKSAWTAEELA